LTTLNYVYPRVKDDYPAFTPQTGPVFDFRRFVLGKKGEENSYDMISNDKQNATMSLKWQNPNSTVQHVQTHSSRKSRTAVCISGQIRTLYKGPGDPTWPPHNKYKIHSKKYDVVHMKGSSVADTIRRNLFGSLQDFDVYMPIFTKGGPREPKVNDTSVCNGLLPNKSGSNMFCEVEAEMPLVHFEQYGIWKQYYYRKNKDLQQGLLQQLHGMHRCSVMIRRNMIQSGVEYDYVIRLRPDMAVHELLPPIASLVTSKNIIRYVDESICCCGNVDWFAVGHSTAMLPYLERYTALQNFGHGVLARPHWPSGKSWTAEGFLVRYMRIYFNVSLRPDKRLYGCIVKPTTRGAPSTP